MAASIPKRQNQNLPSKPETTTWADRVKITEASTRFTLEPIPRSKDGRQPEITMDMLTENAEQWSRCMVGFFPSFRMNYHMVNTVANRVWKEGGLESVMSTASGFWIFRFQTEDQMLAILERGPWMFVWVRLHGLPFTLWSRKGLSVVANMVGKPLSCDEATFCCTKLDYARVCVELDAAEPFTYNFDIKTPFSDEPLHIHVEYEWKPSRCGKCKVFGHACKDAVETGKVLATNLKEAAGETNPSKGEGSGHAPSHVPSCQVMEVKTKKNTEAPKGNDTATKVTCPGKPTAIMEPIVQDDEARARKGKMKENVLTVCLVNESDPLRDKTLSARGVEDGSTLGATDEESTTANGSSSDQRAASPMAFTKILSNVLDDLPARIIVGWNPRVFDVQCMHCTKQWITCRVTSAQHSLDVIVSFIYGLNTPAEREEVWDYIEMQVGWSQSIPWVLLGDFNATMNITDSIGGNTQWNRHKQAFGDCFHNAELLPLPYRGINWEDLLMRAAQRFSSKKGLSNLIAKHCLATTVYFLWTERNNRIFNSHQKPHGILAQEVISQVRLLLMNVTGNVAHNLKERWNI
ncbi:hypothetical protein DKX38_006264 [Salix brachista]|uniref:DUF4283 domain-containing protein n=1 Tax=Salix brachista TaxID=2182728 RepID=A0A5N5N1S5_9ROSI|nr:hypothetical protein DKX38_006264 [Salix brachista]